MVVKRNWLRSSELSVSDDAYPTAWTHGRKELDNAEMF